MNTEPIERLCFLNRLPKFQRRALLILFCGGKRAPEARGTLSLERRGETGELQDLTSRLKETKASFRPSRRAAAARFASRDRTAASSSSPPSPFPAACPRDRKSVV